MDWTIDWKGWYLPKVPKIKFFEKKFPKMKMLLEITL